MDDFARAELERVVGGDRLQSPRGRNRNSAEYEPYVNLPRRRRKRLGGAGFFRQHPHGLPPDVLGDMIIAGVSEVNDYDSAMAWYFSMADRAIVETRREANRRRYVARDKRAREREIGSYYYERLLRNTLSDSDAPPAGHDPERKSGLRSKNYHKENRP